MGDSVQLPPRIDVHSHFLPPEYHDELARNGHQNPDGMPAIPSWSLESHLEMMSTANVTKSILSISSPGTSLVPGDTAHAVRLTRSCNAYAASIKKRFPSKFGFWASLPLPDVAEALEEMKMAKAEGADGFALHTNYHGHYLGSELFDPVFEELNRKNAIVFIHPTTPCMTCQGDYSSSSAAIIKATPLASHHPIPMYEFFFDTARAVTNLFLSGTIARCPNVRFIIPHVGGSMPPVLSRFIGFSHVVPGGRLMNDEEVRKALARQCYFDLAGFVFMGKDGGNGQLASLVKGYGISYDRLLYGSDFPFTPTTAVKSFADRMKNGLENLFEENEREAVYEGNVRTMLAGELEK
ncbi:amidohydrolase 2 [Lepidopterella palustris CBS 459.81]|uniref:6-methylsalicylate decarboxylase n=1 Tax=Lepidopterella palustris CBS 459.81 TaxID=1314670 RepID=A0A8E2JEL1_9PEZI|nr:amidohydrolase 2 [Lepidopterella palustris CBS 459.81]